MTNDTKIASELASVARELAALERPRMAALGRKDFQALAAMMKNTGVASNKKFVKAIEGWLEGQNPTFDVEMFEKALG